MVSFTLSQKQAKAGFSQKQAKAGYCNVSDSREHKGQMYKQDLATMSTADEVSDHSVSCSESEFEEDIRTVSYPVSLLLKLRTRTPRASKPCLGTRGWSELPAGFGEQAESAKTKARRRAATLPAAQVPQKARTESLASTPSAWKPCTTMSDQESTKRAVRSVLNKLTLEKFDALYERLAMDCGLHTPDDMVILMQDVFEKATAQHHFIEMYADLCLRLEEDPRLEMARGVAGEPTSFRHLLLTQCQQAFERLLQPQLPGHEVCRDGQQEQEALRRRCALGNVKLVGHLIVRGMLSSRLLVACSDALLRGHSNCPEALESVAALLSVASLPFDGKKDWQYSDRLVAIFAKISELTKDKKVPARSRFLLTDLLELRAAGWPVNSRPAVAKERPMTLEQVRVQAERPKEPKVSPACAKTLPSAGVKLALVLETSKQAAPPTAQPTAPPPAAQPAPPEFNPRQFRRELCAALKELALDRNVAAAVRKVRAQNVPASLHKREFADLLTRAAEEPRGPARRSAFAFAAGLAAGEDSPAFSRLECLQGIRLFFNDVYVELKDEVPRLSSLMASELIPTLRSVFAADLLQAVLPAEFR